MLTKQGTYYKNSLSKSNPRHNNTSLTTRLSEAPAGKENHPVAPYFESLLSFCCSYEKITQAYYAQFKNLQILFSV